SIALFLLSLTLTLWLGSCSSAPPQQAVSLYVGAAGMFRDVLLEVDKLYQQEAPHVVTSYAFAGTGLIQQKIDRDEPFDIVISANPTVMDDLQTDGFIVPESRKAFFSNQLALIVPKNSSLPIADFKDLTNNRIKTVSLANEQVALGIYAKDLLNNIGIWTALQSKAKWVNLDQREVLKAVEDRTADAGIVFLTDAKLSNNVKIVAIASASLYRPIDTSLAVLKQSDRIRESKQLIEFLISPKAAAIFEKYGFSPIPTSTNLSK
ncbi:MAG: molybdate ABC transporter substrate-binding protein, partial [Microcoleus sp.]